MKGFCFLLLLSICYIDTIAHSDFFVLTPDTIALNQKFEVNVILKGHAGEGFIEPDFLGFMILSGPIRELKRREGIDYLIYSYWLQAKKAGVFYIEKAGIRLGDKFIETERVKVVVTNSIDTTFIVAHSKSKSYPYPEYSFIVADVNDTSIAVLRKLFANDLFVKTAVNKKEAYIRDTIEVNTKLYFRHNLRSFDFKLDTLNDSFRVEELQLDSLRYPSIDTLNGKEFYTVTLTKLYLYPKRTGQCVYNAGNLSITTDIKLEGSEQTVSLEIKIPPAIVLVKNLSLSK